MEGKKFDIGKPDISLIPYEFLTEVSAALMFGEKKYGRYNFLGGMLWTRIASGAMRHLGAWTWGENKDPESGLSHLAHAGACLAMLVSYETRQVGEDNRFKKITSPPCEPSN